MISSFKSYLFLKNSPFIVVIELEYENIKQKKMLQIEHFQ